MMGFAQGIDICYGSTKDDRNVVFFQDGTHREYRIGGILEEVTQDEVVAMLTEGVRTKIEEVFPPARKALPAAEQKDSSGDWYLRLFEEMEWNLAPTAGALFRGSFYESVIRKSVQARTSEQQEQKTGKEYENCGTSAFAKACYEDYIESFLVFAGLVEVIAAHNSGQGDAQTDSLVEMFETWTEGYCETFSRVSTVFRESGVVTVAAHRVENWLPLLLLEYSRIRKRKKCIRYCENCGRIFVTQGRSDAIYCDFPAPQNPDRRCNEIGAQIRRRKNRGRDETERAHHITICRLHNMIRRAKDRGDGSELIEYYRRKIDDEMVRYETEKDKKHGSRDKNKTDIKEE